MKSAAFLSVLLTTTVWLAGCDNIFTLDNYEEPTSVLSGRVIFDGSPLGVRSDGVELELWQPSFEEEFGVRDKIPVNVNQDGTFSAVIFDGDYELNLLPGNGPWVDDPTRRLIQVRGEATIDVEVVPYHVIRNEQIVKNNDVVEATFNIGQVETSRDLEFVGLYVSRTTFVDRINMDVRAEATRADLGSLDAPVSLSVELPAEIYIRPAPGPREEVFVRVGVKTVGVAEMLFTQVHKIGI